MTSEPSQIPRPRARRFTVFAGEEVLHTLDGAWDAVAERANTPFMLGAWLTSWCEAFDVRELVLATVREPDGTLAAGALLRKLRGGLGAPSDDLHTGDWNAVAVDDAARELLWEGVAALGHRRLRLGCMREGDPATAIAGNVLESAGYRIVRHPHVSSPYLALPGSWDELLAARSSNLRQQWRRRRRALDREGEVVLRVTTGGERLEQDLDTLLAVEASGWKGRQATAITSDPRTRRLYCAFARRAAARGALRLYLLELDGRAVAADLGCVVGDVGALIKTGFDETHAHLAPGLVLRGEVLRASCEEGLAGYDFLGGPDEYKLRWTDEVRPRIAIGAHRGVTGAAVQGYHRTVRPVLAQAVRRARRARLRDDA